MRVKVKTTKPSASEPAGLGNVNRVGKPRYRAAAGGDTTDEADLLKLVPGGLVASFVKQKLHDAALEVAGLAAPADWDGDMPQVPDNIAAVDHSELSNLLAQFVNCQSTALWHASTAYIEAGYYDEIAEYLENVSLVNSAQSNDTKRKAEAKTTDAVMAAKTLQRNAYSDYVRFRDLAKTLELRWKTVSRVGGFVGDEAEGEEASASKSSTRGMSAGASKAKTKGVVRRTAKR
jgi:hypothetical protein